MDRELGRNVFIAISSIKKEKLKGLTIRNYIKNDTFIRINGSQLFQMIFMKDKLM